MEELKLPGNLAANPLVWIAITMLGSMLKEIIVGVLRGLVKRWRSDKDPKNDTFADGVEAAADAIDKLPKLPIKK